MQQPLRIFISSPGDVADERRRAALVIGRLKREFAHFFDLMPVLWEYEPMLSSGHFQDIIEPPSAVDIMVLILWSRLGTPLPERTAKREYRGIDGRAPVTGTEWEFEQAVEAQRQRGGTPDLLVYRKFADGFARFSRADQLDQIKQQWEALQGFWERHFEGPDGFKAAFNRFTDLDEFEAQLEVHLRELLKRRLPPREIRGTKSQAGERIDWWAGSPYRGLQAFDMTHAAVFFGRERAEREITEALVQRASDGEAFMLVLGASGSGKSSLARAGLLPDVMAPGVVSGISTWRHVIVHPAELAPDVALGLADALTRAGALPELAALGYQDAEIAEALRGGGNLLRPPLRSALERAAAADPRATAGVSQGRLVVVLDQLEVLFTSSAITADERRAFGRMITGLAQSGLVWIVATMRSDFFHRLAETPELNELAAGLGQYQLAHPTAAELDQIIGRPAEAAGLSFEEEKGTGISLAATIREAAARDPASLPLLSFLLDELYRRDIEKDGGDVLTYASYRDLGMLEGAIARHADELVAGLPPELAGAVDALLLSLVQVDEISGTTTARLIKQAIIVDPLQQEVADRLVAGRLAVADDPGDGRTLRLAHEALLGHWPRLTRLIDEHRDFLIVRRRLQADAANWQRHDSAPDLLLPRGRRLAEAEDTLARRRADLDPELVAYVEASSTAEQERQARRSAEQQRALQEKLARSRRFALSVSLLLVLSVAAGVFAWHQRTLATAARVDAEKSYRLALDQAAGGLQQLIDSYQDGGVPNKLLGQLVERARKTVDGLTDESEDVTEARARLLGVLALATVDLGNLPEAHKLAKQGLALADGLAAKSPADQRWKLLQARVSGRFSDVLFRSGDAPAATVQGRAAYEKLASLAAANPEDALLQREFMDNHERIGMALRNMGRLDEAAAIQREWIKYAEALILRQPGSNRWRRYLALAHEELGDTLHQKGEVLQAAATYQMAAAIAAQLAAAERGNKDYVVLVAGTRLRVGDAFLQQGDFGGALGEYEASRLAAYQLSTGDPSVFIWRQGLGVAHQRKGDLYLQADNPAAALVEFLTYRKLALENLDLAPQSGSAQFDVSNARQKVGDALRQGGNLDEALAEYREALSIAQDLEALPVKNARWQKSLAMDHQRIGLTLMQKGDLQGALAEFKECLAIPVNKLTWSPRERWPADVTEDCRRRIIELGGIPGR